MLVEQTLEAKVTRHATSSTGAWTRRRARRNFLTLVAVLVMGMATLSAGSATAQEETSDIPSGVPDHYPALRIYAEGEILEVLNGGRALRILAPARDEHLFGDGRSDPRDPLGTGGVRSLPGLPRRAPLVVNMRSAQGWLFIDDPQGGPQERVRLDHGRELFAPGQLIEIGPAPGLESEATEGRVRSQTTAAGLTRTVSTVLSISVTGWVYVRLNRFKEGER